MCFGVNVPAKIISKHKESLTGNKQRVSYLVSLTFHSVDLAENQKAALSESRGGVVMLVPSTVGEDLHYLVI